ncbi:MAG TPA: LLM class flavin-dependent oxidoreductase [Solirubrobacterales bacterium]|nr:LLM class flavin-dependent oxidoreductase [Solirubrobacterales bacterium]
MARDPQAGLRLGVWAIVGGSWAARSHPEDPVDASWERNKALVLEAEELGFDSTLVAQHTLNARGPGNDQLEAWTASAGLAALTGRIEVICAIKPYLYHPVVLAKMALQIEEMSRGRFAINVVNAWFRPELERAGIGFAEHDERYAYGREWLAVVRGLIAGETVSFEGEYFKIDDYLLEPADSYRARPTIYLGGESEPARALAADLADVWFINGQPPGDVRDLIEDLRRRPRAGAPLRFGLAAFVIARATEAEAQEELAYAWELAAKDKAEMEHLFANVDPKAVMFQKARANPAIGTNGGTAAGLVGSYDQVAERILAFHRLGIELFMLQFQPFEREMRRFAEHLFPRVEAARADSPVGVAGVG